MRRLFRRRQQDRAVRRRGNARVAGISSLMFLHMEFASSPLPFSTIGFLIRYGIAVPLAFSFVNQSRRRDKFHIDGETYASLAF